MHKWLAALCSLLACLQVVAAEPNFERTRADVAFLGPDRIYYSDGDTVCKLQEIGFNATGGSITSLGFADHPDWGEGCWFFLTDSSSTVFWQNWANRSYICANGYQGPYKDEQNQRYCTRHPLLPVVKPPVCPNCEIGNPIGIADATKLYRADDIVPVDGLGFRRTYRSRGPFHYGDGSANLGPAWFAEHGQTIKLQPGDSSSAAKAYVYRPDGTMILFLRSDSAAQWVSEQDERRHRLADKVLPGGGSGYALDLPDGTQETYDGTGRLMTSVSPSGEVLTYEYEQGLLARVVNRKGRRLSFTFNAKKQVQRVSDDAGGFVEFAYESDGRLRSATYPDYFERYAYTSISAVSTYLIGVYDAAGNALRTYAYDPWNQGDPYTTERPGGMEKYTVGYATDRVITTTPLGANTNYSFRILLGRRVIDKIEYTCAGCTSDVTTFKYDGNLNITEQQQGSSKTCFAHDPARNLETVRVEGAHASLDCATLSGTGFSRKVITQWHPQLRSPTVIETFDGENALLSRTTRGYNGRGQQISTVTYDAINGLTRSTTSSYCEQTGVDSGTCPQVGLLLSVDGPRTDVSDVTQYRYYSADHPGCATSPGLCAWRKGDLWKVIDPTGRVTEALVYDGAGRAISTKDTNGVVTDFEYDPRGRLITRTMRGSN